VNIITTDLEDDCCIQTLVAGRQNFEDLLIDFPQFKQLDEFLNNLEQVKLKDPIIVGLTDLLER
jgi:hypothetical protein